MDRKSLDLFSIAVETAAVAHRKQMRKGNGTPYITHPFAVALLLQQAGCSEEVIVAGLLHDTLEDTELSVKEVEARFGANVAYIVLQCSENDKSRTWEERKQNTIYNLQSISQEACMVVCADKLHNIRSTVREFEVSGESVWNRFNRGREKQEWYYRNIVDVLGARISEFPLYPLLKQEVDELFN